MGGMGAIPMVRRGDGFRWSAGLVVVECLVILMTRGGCSKTDRAARYNQRRAEHSDTYLPVCLVRWNETDWETLFVGGLFLLRSGCFLEVIL